MAKRYQYPAKTQPISTVPEVVHADAWVQPQVQPTRNYWMRAARCAVALVATGMAVRSIPFNAASAAEVVHADAWVQPQTQPYRNFDYRARRYQSTVIASGMQVRSIPWNAASAAEVVTVDRWGQPQSQPIFNNYALRADRYNAAIDSADGQQIGGSPAVVTAPESSWDPLFPDLLRRYATFRFSRARYEPACSWSTFTPSGAVAISYDWIPQTGQPYPSRKLLSAANQADLTFGPFSTDPEVVTEDRWHQPQSQPFPYLRRLLAALNPAVFWGQPTDQEAVTEDRWHPTWPQPFPYRRALSAAIRSQDGSFDSAAQPISEEQEVVTADRWAQPQSQPYPYRRVLRSALQQATFWNTSTVAEVVTEDRWHPTFPQPYPYLRRLATASQTANFWHVSTDAETVTSDRWVQPQSQPYPSRRFLAAANQQASFWSGFTPPFVETVTLDKWFNAGSQPYPYRRVLQTSEQQASFWNTSTAKEDITEDRWHQPQSQPTYRRARLAQFPAHFWNTSTAQETVTEDRWHQSASSPYPYQRRLRTALNPAFFWGGFTPAPIEVVTLDKWFEPPSQPTYRRARVVQFPNHFWNTSTTQETVTADRFAQPTNEPYPYQRFNRYFAALLPGISWNSSTETAAVTPAPAQQRGGRRGRRGFPRAAITEPQVPRIPAVSARIEATQLPSSSTLSLDLRIAAQIRAAQEPASAELQGNMIDAEMETLLAIFMEFL